MTLADLEDLLLAMRFQGAKNDTRVWVSACDHWDEVKKVEYKPDLDIIAIYQLSP